MAEVGLETAHQPCSPEGWFPDTQVIQVLGEEEVAESALQAGTAPGKCR